MIIGSIAEELSLGYNTWPAEVQTQVAEAPRKQWRKKVLNTEDRRPVGSIRKCKIADPPRTALRCGIQVFREKIQQGYQDKNASAAAFGTDTVRICFWIPAFASASRRFEQQPKLLSKNSPDWSSPKPLRSQNCQKWPG